MSALLDLLLDPACRRECEAHDAADKEMDMRHGIRSASRQFADMERSKSLDPSDDGETDRLHEVLDRIGNVGPRMGEAELLEADRERNVDKAQRLAAANDGSALVMQMRMERAFGLGVML
jgi:hypothetical protein